MPGHYDGTKFKTAQNAILDRIAATISQTPATGVRDLAEAFSLLENASKSK